jgi:hypothetical protein
MPNSLDAKPWRFVQGDNMRVRNHPGITRAGERPVALPLPRGMNSDFCSKIDQSVMSACTACEQLAL